MNWNINNSLLFRIKSLLNPHSAPLLSHEDLFIFRLAYIALRYMDMILLRITYLLKEFSNVLWEHIVISMTIDFNFPSSAFLLSTNNYPQILHKKRPLQKPSLSKIKKENARDEK